MKKTLIAVMFAGIVLPTALLAQMGPGGPDGWGGPGGRGGRGRGPGGPGGGFGQSFVDTSELQAQLKSTNEEWLVINPMLQKLIVARQAIATPGNGNNGGGGFGGPGGGGPGGPGMGNDTFGGPSDVAAGNRGGPGGRGGRGGGGGFGGPGGPGGGGFGQGFGPDGPGGGPLGQGEVMPVAASPPATAPAARTTGDDSGKAHTMQIITLSQALSDLQTALADTSTSQHQIKELLETVRAARAKATAEAKSAEKELKQVLTARQIAVLVSRGYLD